MRKRKIKLYIETYPSRINPMIKSNHTPLISVYLRWNSIFFKHHFDQMCKFVMQIRYSENQVFTKIVGFVHSFMSKCFKASILLKVLPSSIQIRIKNDHPYLYFNFWHIKCSFLVLLTSNGCSKKNQLWVFTKDLLYQKLLITV